MNFTHVPIDMRRRQDHRFHHWTDVVLVVTPEMRKDIRRAYRSLRATENADWSRRLVFRMVATGATYAKWDERPAVRIVDHDVYMEDRQMGATQ